jgi:hypothetical protein
MPVIRKENAEVIPSGTVSPTKIDIKQKYEAEKAKRIKELQEAGRG